MFVHVLLFGGAIAIAEYGGALLRSSQDHIMVSFIEFSGSEAGVSLTVGQRQPQNRSKPVETLPPRATAIHVPAEITRGEQSDQNSQEAAEVNAADAQQQEGPSPSGAGTASGIGIVSAEQWAVIDSQIEKVKNYPRLARERGIQGVVRVRFKLKPSGVVDRVEIAKSSGSEVLDAASVKTVYRASPMPYVNGWLEVPMTYVLK